MKKTYDDDFVDEDLIDFADFLFYPNNFDQLPDNCALRKFFALYSLYNFMLSKIDLINDAY